MLLAQQQTLLAFSLSLTGTIELPSETGVTRTGGDYAKYTERLFWTDFVSRLFVTL